MKKIWRLRTFFSILSLLTLVFQPLGLRAQGSTCDSSNSPNPSNALLWARNAQVTVNINSNQFSPAEFACLTTLFNSINAQSGSNGNNSGVSFTLNYNTSTLTTLQLTGGGGIAVPTAVGSTFTNRYQIDRPPGGVLGDGSTDFGLTALNVNSSSLNTAVTQINSQVTGCNALQIVVAHEIAHTFGLGHCDSPFEIDLCAPDESVMALPACPTAGCPPSEYTNPSTGRTSFSPCDNQVIHAAGNYGSSGGGGGGGEPMERSLTPYCSGGANEAIVWEISYDSGETWQYYYTEYKPGCPPWLD